MKINYGYGINVTRLFAHIFFIYSAQFSNFIDKFKNITFRLISRLISAAYQNN